MLGSGEKSEISLLDILSPIIPELIEIQATESEIHQHIRRQWPVDIFDVYDSRVACEKCTGADECRQIVRTYGLVRGDSGFRVDFKDGYCEHWPDPWREAKVIDLVEAMQVPAKFKYKDLGNYNPENETQTRALELCRQYVDEYRSNLARGAGMVEAGTAGTGKTHLLVGVGKALIKKYLTDVLFVDVGEFTSDFMHGARAFEQKAKSIERMKKVELLILDDLGAEEELQGEKGKGKPVVMNIIMHRYNASRPTLYSTNLPINADAFEDGSKRTLPGYMGARAYSRLRGQNDLVKVLGGDYRSKKIYDDPAMEDPNLFADWESLGKYVPTDYGRRRIS